MNVNQSNFRGLNFDKIAIQPEWNMPETQECRMHSIHAYPAKFPAFITTKAIKIAEEEGLQVTSVGDIFCGCGTVAFETVSNGKHFWGCDINPVATLIARAKSRKYEDGRLENYYKIIQTTFNDIGVDKDDEVFQNERINYWFDEQHISDLLRLRTAIKTAVDDEPYLEFFLCAFSNILKSCSRWLTKSIKPQVDPIKTPKTVAVAFKEQVKMMRKANAENTSSMEGTADVETVNFLEKEIEGPFVDLVVTSPPYVTSYEYADLHQLSTLWLGYTNDFRTFRKGTIGSLHHSDDFAENMKMLNETGLEIVMKIYSVDKKKSRAVAQYYNDMQKAVHKVKKMLLPGGACLFVIGNTEYQGMRIDNAKHLVECLFAEGFRDVSVDRRKISNKILTPYRDANGKFAMPDASSKKVYAEEFVVFAKQQ